MAENDEKVIALGEEAVAEIAVVLAEHRMPLRPGAPRPAPPDVYLPTVPFKNVSGFALPEGGIGWVEGGETDGVSHSVTRPEYPGISRCIIAATPVPDGEHGRGYTGFQPCSILLADYAGTDVGDFVGTGKDLFTAVKYPGGLFLVLAKLTTPYARVIRIQNRLDNKMIRTGAGAADGRPVKVLILNASHVVTQTAPNRLGIASA